VFQNALNVFKVTEICELLDAAQDPEGGFLPPLPNRKNVTEMIDVTKLKDDAIIRHLL